MKKLVLIAMCFAAFVLFAEAEPNSRPVVRSRTGRQLTQEEVARQEQNRVAMLESTGGFLLDKRESVGSVAIINAQKKVDPTEIAKYAARLEGAIAMRVKCLQSDKMIGFTNLDAVLASASSTVYVVVIEDDQMPSMVSLPEKKCALVNVSPLSAGGVDKEKTLERTRKQIARAVCFVFSTGYSGTQGSVMEPVFNIEQLDKILVDNVSVAQKAQIEKAATQFFGMRRFRRTTYAKACHEGWAPPPQDKYQKAIWDSVHELPTRPLVIEPEK